MFIVITGISALFYCLYYFIPVDYFNNHRHSKIGMCVWGRHFFWFSLKSSEKMSEKEVWAAPDLFWHLLKPPKDIRSNSGFVLRHFLWRFYTQPKKTFWPPPHQFTVFVDSKFPPNSKQFTRPNKNLIPLFGQHRFSKWCYFFQKGLEIRRSGL